MPVKSSGDISLDVDIAGEFGGTRPHSISEYYKGGSLVSSVATAPNIPTSGQISFSNFYDSAAQFIPTSANSQFYTGSYDVFTRGDGRYGVRLKTSGTLFTGKVVTATEYLVVAGGGRGSFSAGGGGAGGLRQGTNLALDATAMSVTIGAGGSNHPGGDIRAAWSKGGDSTIKSITATGGGSAGEYNEEAGPYTTGQDGGSGGGGGGAGGGPRGAGAGNTPATSPSQGNNGAAASTYRGGGGGGAGAAGGSDSVGGNGIQSSITGTATYYAGGGTAARDNAVRAGGLGGGGGHVNQGGGPGFSYTLGGTNLGGGGGCVNINAGSSPPATAGGGSGVIILVF